MALLKITIKLQSQWDITAWLLDWLSSKREEVSSGEHVEKKESLCTLVKMWIGAVSMENKTELL